jgi:uncharacterized protein (TIGR00251 family)
MSDKREAGEAPEAQAKTASIRVRLLPRAQKGLVVGWTDDGALTVKVLAAPEAGRANIELLRVVAEHLRIPVRHVSLESGSSSTNKILKIQGLDEEELRRRIDR